ncbi:MAG TPA: S9 family peptidase [Bacteroidales bacterium]|nr:S9 family peptidase [Bacteroidales bacterium]HSA43832.1 S9 family peptidase [Bacteroidales bacterium]
MNRKSFALLLLTGLSALCAFGQNNKEITLKDIWGSRQFLPKRPPALTSLSDGVRYYQEKGDSVNVYFYESGQYSATLFLNSELVLQDSRDTLQMDDFTLSADEKKVLISTGTEPIYRRSSKSEFYIFDLTTRQLSRLCDRGKQRLADFSPDATKVAYFLNNDLYIRDLTGGKEIRISHDGKINNIINGAADWVYEEEFEFSKAFFWSPDGRYLAYYRFDESKVREFSYTVWGTLYPEEYRYKYPKAGEDNSVVSIHIYEVATGKTLQVDPGRDKDSYIPRIRWTADPGKLCIYWMNRLQNRLELHLADAATGKTTMLYEEDNPAYIEINDHLTFTDDRKYFFLSSEKGGSRHLYLYGMDGRLIRQITHGNWEVTDVLGYDQKKKVIYFSTTESGPLNRDISRINLDGTRMKRLSHQTGWNDAEFSEQFQYFRLTFSDANTPPVSGLYDQKGKALRILEDNAALSQKVSEYQFGRVEFMSIPGADGTLLNAYMIKPAGFDQSKKYPVLMNVYGGPGSQSVENRWGYYDFIWYQMLARKGYIPVSVDNRGTGFRGEQFKKCTYGQLGKLETEDQIAAARYLASQPYVDGGRIGIWGWSYGGYMTALCMTKGADVFKTGIAVAPVMNWRYYDNIYTERFMGLPRDNAAGYDDNSPIHFAKELKGNFLMVHGTADDNVHLQNAIEFSNALIRENKQFTEFFYPNRNHGIYGGNTRLHLYRMMTDFLLDKL